MDFVCKPRTDELQTLYLFVQGLRELAPALRQELTY